MSSMECCRLFGKHFLILHLIYGFYSLAMCLFFERVHECSASFSRLFSPKKLITSMIASGIILPV